MALQRNAQARVEITARELKQRLEPGKNECAAGRAEATA